MTKNVDKIKDKISKLLAKAHGTENQHESASFMAKVEELLTAHQLTIGDVLKNDPMERTVLFVAPIAPREWHINIPTIVAEYYGCKVIRVRERNRTLMVAVGRESTRVTAELMLGFVVEQLRALVKEYQAQTLYSARKAMQDICDAFYSRVRELIRQREKTAEAHGNTDRALVLMDEAEAAMKELFPNMKFTEGKELTLTVDAMKLADRVKLDRQVDGAAATLQLTHG